MVWDNTHVGDEPAGSGLSAKATLTIALAGITGASNGLVHVSRQRRQRPAAPNPA